MEPASYQPEIARLRSLGWTCEWHPEPTEFPPEIHLRYPWLPPEYLDFVRGLDECVNPDETRWILAPADFDIRQHHAFRHDEWEQLGIESADGDEALIREIRSFWDAHIPICFDVGDGYSFHAIRVSDRSGVVVAGREPEFEVVSEAAFSFREFLAGLE
jgi:hypothetical protein